MIRLDTICPAVELSVPEQPNPDQNSRHDAYYTALLDAWFATRMEKDRTLLVLSAGGIGRGANYTLRDNKFYSCASWLNGKACSNKIGVRRDLVERLLLAEIKAGLASPEIVEHVRQELTRRLRRKAPTVDKARVRALEQQVGNLVDAIASGALRSSPAIVARLAAAEAELERIKAAAPNNAPVVALLPRLG